MSTPLANSRPRRANKNREGEAPAEPLNGELPEGWILTSLGNVSQLVAGAGFPLDLQGQKGRTFPFFKVGSLGGVESGQDLVSSIDSVDDATARVLKAKIIPQGSIVFAKIGMAIRLNRRRAVGVPCCIDNNMMAAIPSDAVNGRYLLRFLETIDLMPLASATTVPSIRKSALNEVPIPLPPLAEQRWIVAKVEALLARVYAARQRLARLPANLKRFRQATLAAACDGRLTADWRETNTKIESASGRKIRLSHVREQVWRRTNKLNRSYIQPFEPAEPTPFELPDKWCWATVSHLCFQDVGFAFRSKEFSKNGIRLLRGENIEPGSLRWSDTCYWPKNKCKDFQHLFVREGEIILGMDRPIVSAGLKIARAKSSDLPCILVQRVMRFRMLEEETAAYLFRCLQSFRFTEFLSHDGMTGSDLPHITGTGVAEFPIPLPPLVEQHEIVRRVEALFKLADAIERRTAAAAARADRLTQAILAKAFCGQLVPTEAELARREGRDYEPASALLKRIQSAAPGCAGCARVSRPRTRRSTEGLPPTALRRKKPGG